MAADIDPDTGPRTRLVAGRYALSDVIGRGGMGTVWLATDRVLEREVALKEVTFSVDLTTEERTILRERTLREARAAARLDHPRVARVYDVVEEDGRPWLVMEHVSARSLQDIIEERGPLPPAAVAQIGLDVLAALEAAHGAGIVHRDVKPANVLVEPDGHARLTDFGIATTTGDSSLTTARRPDRLAVLHGARARERRGAPAARSTSGRWAPRCTPRSRAGRRSPGARRWPP